MGQLSIMGLFENLALFAPLLLLILIPAGFIGSAWVTNRVFALLGREADEANSLDRIGTLVLLGGLFTAYIYALAALLLE